MTRKLVLFVRILYDYLGFSKWANVRPNKHVYTFLMIGREGSTLLGIAKQLVCNSLKVGQAKVGEGGERERGGGREREREREGERERKREREREGKREEEREGGRGGRERKRHREGERHIK